MLQKLSDILPDQNPSDKELVQLAQQGDFSAFSSLYERHFSSVHNRVRYLIPEQDVEDVTQEVFVAVIRSLKNFRFESQFSTWLRTITNRNIADYYRKRERSKEHLNLNLDKLDLHQARTPVASRKRVDENILLCQGLLALPEHYREIILLRFAEGLRFHEIAKVRGQSLEATKSLFRRALSSLRKQLQESYD